MLKETLVKLRKQKDLSQYEITNLLGIPRSTYAMYEAGHREPDFAMLKKLADFFNVSIDYLLGRTDDSIPTIIQNQPVLERVVGMLRATDDLTASEKKTLADEIADYFAFRKQRLKEGREDDKKGRH